MSVSKEKQQEMISRLVQRLPSIRRELNISQTKFGEKVGLSRQTISAIERGATGLSWNNYLGIMMFLVAKSGNDTILCNELGSEVYDVLNEISTQKEN